MVRSMSSTTLHTALREIEVPGEKKKAHFKSALCALCHVNALQTQNIECVALYPLQREVREVREVPRECGEGRGAEYMRRLHTLHPGTLACKRRRRYGDAPSLLNICLKRLICMQLRHDPHLTLQECLKGAQENLGGPLELEAGDAVVRRLTEEYWVMCEGKHRVMSCQSFWSACKEEGRPDGTCEHGGLGHWDFRCSTFSEPY